MTAILIDIKTDGEFCGECHLNYETSSGIFCLVFGGQLEPPLMIPQRCQQCLDAEQKAKAGEDALFLQAYRGGQ